MKVMVIVKATPNSEAGAMPSEQLLTEMGNYNEELVKAGIMLAGEGLLPSARGKRIRFSSSDARGLGLTPSMAPRVVDEAGKEVYGAELVSEKGLQQGGIVAYAKAEEKAKERAGDKALTIKALRIADKSKTDVVISIADADKLRAPNTNLSFLAEGKVVILVD